MNTHITKTLLFALLLPACAQLPAQPVPAAAPALQAGAGSFVFSDPACPQNPPVTVWYYNPGVREDAPVVFVMHGAGASARDYRDGWAACAAEKKFLLLAPEFCPPEEGSQARCNLGGMVDDAGAGVAEPCWSFTALERVFDTAKAAAGITTGRYAIYGHSAGGQFVHRLVLFKPDARIATAIAANAGWYTMPDFKAAFPYGLAQTSATTGTLRTSFSRRLVILVGENDTDPHHPGLRTSPEAMAQGAHRRERGTRFFTTARAAAAAAGAAFAWQIKVVPGAGHDSAALSREAAAVLLDQ